MHYYGLNLPPQGTAEGTPSHVAWPSLGIGPVTLAPTLNHTGVVSQTDSSRLRVSGSHVWAGDLDQILTHLLAQQLANLNGSPRVSPHPWDHRSRPEYQVKIHVEALGGPLDGPVQLRLNWVLLGERGEQELLRERQTYTCELAGSGYEAYVAGLNTLVIQFGEDLHQQIDARLAQP